MLHEMSKQAEVNRHTDAVLDWRLLSFTTGIILISLYKDYQDKVFQPALVLHKPSNNDYQCSND